MKPNWLSFSTLSLLAVLAAGLPLLAQQPSCVTPPEGLVAWWRAEGSTAEALGASDGSTPYGIAYSAGKVGKAFEFDGSRRRLSVSDKDLFKLESLTIEAWVNITGDGHFILFRGDNRGGADPYCLTVSLPGFVQFQIGALDAQEVLRAPVTYGQWHHVAGTFDSLSGDMKLYLNGALAAKTNTAVRPLKELDPRYEPALGIGNHGGTFHQFPFNGLIDEVSLYSRALTAAEVFALFTAGSAGKCELVAAPVVTRQPQSQSVLAGSDVVFSVEAQGTAPLSYQWRKDGLELAGATLSSLLVSSAQPALAGAYSVRVSNSGGSTMSANAVLAVFSPGECMPVPEGLVSWWRAEGSMRDAIGTNDGVAHGHATLVPGKVGQGFSFDGNGSYLEVADSPSLRLTNEFTIEFWYKDTGSPVGHHFYGLVAKRGDYPAGCNFGINFYAGTPSFLQLYVKEPDQFSYQASSSPLPAPGAFHHLAASYRQLGPDRLELKTYVDGALVKTDVVTANLAETVNSAPVTIGSDNSFEAFFVGIIDEPSVYGRVLTDAEIMSLYKAAEAGKCAGLTAPVITSQPQSQSVLAGADVVFTVNARGSEPLAYRWQHDGRTIEGATASTLVLTDVTLSQAGKYAVVITNVAGSATSSNALLTVSSPITLVSVSDTTATAARPVEVPITVAANGDENALAFSLSFDVARLAFSGVRRAAYPDAALLINDTQAGSGRVGVMFGLPAGKTLTAGTQEVLIVSFTSSRVTTNEVITRLTFGDVPIPRQLAGESGTSLRAMFAGGTVRLLPAGLEGDVYPRPGGDANLNLNDWVLAGRYAAQLDTPTNNLEFIRADCAPRETLGDGSITVTDWVQTGRYAAALDPITVTGGPTIPREPKAVVLPEGALRQLRVQPATLLPRSSGAVRILLVAEGDENALGFSLQFPTNLLAYQGAAVASTIPGAQFHVNARQAADGRLGFVLALPVGSQFVPGTQEVARITFLASSSETGSGRLSFTELPVAGQISDQQAGALGAQYLSGEVTIMAAPMLTITPKELEVELSWPGWASNFVLQTAATLSGSVQWSNAQFSVTLVGTNRTARVPIENGGRLYRLRQE